MPGNDYTLKLTTSWRADGAQIQKTLQPVDMLEVGGAGNKCSRIIHGEVDAYFHPLKGLSNWDLCAPESLVKAMGGYATNLFNEKLRYNTDGSKTEGLLLGRNPMIHKLIQNRAGPKVISALRKTLR